MGDNDTVAYDPSACLREAEAASLRRRQARFAAPPHRKNDGEEAISPLALQLWFMIP